jgi:hypothetical protein
MHKLGVDHWLDPLFDGLGQVNSSGLSPILCSN